MAECAPRVGSDHLTKLPEAILGRILFSGYLSTKWYHTVGIILVSKKIFELGKTYIAYVDNSNRIQLDTFTQKISPLGVLGIQSVARNVVLLDLSFSTIEYSPEVGQMIVSMRGTLRGLSLRGTGVKDDFLRNYVGSLTHLRYLNLAQTSASERAYITDEGATHLCALTQLKWLNISTSSITAKTLIALQAAAPRVFHLDLFGCKLLTDDALPALCAWKLQTLDISNCPLLTMKAFEALCDTKESAASRTLETLACAYCPAAPSVRALPVLLQLPRLRRLDLRKSMAEVVPAELNKQVRAQLEVAVLEQDDVLKYVKELSIIPSAPALTALCPVLRWPYRSEEL